MRLILSIICLLSAAVAFLPARHAARAAAPTFSARLLEDVAAIESYTRQLDRSVKRNQLRARYFADVSPYEENARPRWREYTGKRALDQAWEKNETYTSASIWSRATGNPLVAEFTLSSPSGDWVHYITKYYRADGTLAKMHGDMRTFYGDVNVLRDRYYDASGKMLREQTRFLDLTTKKPKKVKEGEYADQPFSVYTKVSDLPFYNLLKKR